METLLLLGFFLLIGFVGTFVCRAPKNEKRNRYYGDPNVHLRNR
jgi:hypothetical protein